MISLEQYRAAIGCFCPRCCVGFISANHSINLLLHLLFILFKHFLSKIISSLINGCTIAFKFFSNIIASFENGLVLVSRRLIVVRHRNHDVFLINSQYHDLSYPLVAICLSVYAICEYSSYMHHVASDNFDLLLFRFFCLSQNSMSFINLATSCFIPLWLMLMLLLA